MVVGTPWAETQIFDYVGIKDSLFIVENILKCSLDKYDGGHTPHYQHRIENATDLPIFVPQFKVTIGDEKALDEMSNHLTATHVLIEQPSVHNTLIFLVAKRGGPSSGQKRFVQDFRKRNASSKDKKCTIRDGRESLTAVGKLKPKIFSKCDFTEAFYLLPLEKNIPGSPLIPSSSPSVKIQIVGGKVCLRCKGKTLLGVVNKLLKTERLLTSPSNVLPYYLK